MSYEEAFRRCPRCGVETWHGRDVLDVYRHTWLTALSHLVTVGNDLFVPWRCLTCSQPGDAGDGRDAKS